MSETATPDFKTDAAKKVAKAVAASTDLPAVVDTVEVAMEVPAKVVLSNKLVVAVSVIAGAGLGAGVLWGVNKWRSRKAAQLEVPDTIEEDAQKAS